MSETNFFFNLFSDDSLKKIGVYFYKFIDLFFKPVQTWKSIINYRKNSLEIFIFYILIYLVMLFLLVDDILLSFRYLILTLIVILQPFLIMLIPFLIFRKVWNKKIKINRLYRLFVVFNIQIFPLIYLPILVYKKFEVETAFIISDNAITFCDILIIFVLPLLLRLQWWKKFIWIFVNYIFINLFFLTMNYLAIELPDFVYVKKEIEIRSPAKEFEYFIHNYKNSDNYIHQDIFLILNYKNEENKEGWSPQFLTYQVLDALIGKNLEASKRAPTIFEEYYKKNKQRIDDKSIFLFGGPDSLLKIPFKFKKNELVSINELIELRKNYNKIFFEDKKLMDSLTEHSVSFP